MSIFQSSSQALHQSSRAQTVVLLQPISSPAQIFSTFTKIDTRCSEKFGTIICPFRKKIKETDELLKTK